MGCSPIKNIVDVQGTQANLFATIEFAMSWLTPVVSQYLLNE